MITWRATRKRPERVGRRWLTQTHGVDSLQPEAEVGWLEFQAFDTNYVDKLRCRDEVTEQHFVGYFSELISLKLRSRLQSAQAIQDVRQETFARIFVLLRKEGGIRQGERLGALVNSICNNVLFEHYRSGKRTEPLEGIVADNLLDHQPDALRQAISRQTQASVHEVLDSLGERDRKVLRYLFVEERDKDAICEELGIDREYMRVLIHRAKKAFRERYDAGPSSPSPMTELKPRLKRIKEFGHNKLFGGLTAWIIGMHSAKWPSRSTCWAN
jgi:RNA polymerase sigma-70 factor (ECF subfamily)